jgi:hypothetical protein
MDGVYAAYNGEEGRIWHVSQVLEICYLSRDGNFAFPKLRPHLQQLLAGIGVFPD